MIVDCMACLVALAQNWPKNGTYKDLREITHATFHCESYGEWQALTCTFRKDGRLRLVRR